MNKGTSKVDQFLSAETQWKEEFTRLREIIVDCQLREEFKWRHPCYTFEDKNVVLIHGFKEYCAILFFKGALLQDPDGILVQQTENVQAARQIRFRNAAEVEELGPTVKNFINQAIEIEKAGLKVKLKETTDFGMPEELEVKFNQNPALRTAFEGLTPGRQRAYIFYFSSAKQSNTRNARIEKYIDKILNGKGMDD